jgi:endonuclease/exonuclease/phosphatase (EEP) superfamily protein YafD
VRGFDADVVVVLESWREHDGRGVLDDLVADGYKIETIAFRKMIISSRRARHDDHGEGCWELAICSRFPITAIRELPIGTIHADPAGPRSALMCTIDVEGVEVDIIGAHVSSRLWSLAPVRHLLALKRQIPPPGRTVVIAGDCNLWGPAVVAIFKQWKRAVLGPTYPAHKPHSQIDHILVRDDVTVLSGEVLAKTPSDHRPIRARLRVGNAPGPGRTGAVG